MNFEQSMFLLNVILLISLTYFGISHIRKSPDAVRWDVVLLGSYLLFVMITAVEVWLTIVMATSPAGMSWLDIFFSGQRP